MSLNALQLGYNIGKDIGNAKFGAEDRKLAREQARANIDSQLLKNEFTQQQIQSNALNLQTLQQQFDDLQANRLIDSFNAAGRQVALTNDASQLEYLLNDPKNREMLKKYAGLDPFENISILPVDDYDPQKLSDFISDVAYMRAMDKYAAVGQNLPVDYQVTPEELDEASKSVRLGYDSVNNRTQLIDLNTISKFLFPNGYYQGQHDLLQQQKRRDAIKAALEARKTVSEINKTDSDRVVQESKENRELDMHPTNKAKAQSETNKNIVDANKTQTETAIKVDQAEHNKAMAAFMSSQSKDNPFAKPADFGGYSGSYNPQPTGSGGDVGPDIIQNFHEGFNQLRLGNSNQIDKDGNYIPYTQEQGKTRQYHLSQILNSIASLKKNEKQALMTQDKVDVIAAEMERMSPIDAELTRKQFNNVMEYDSNEHLGNAFAEFDRVGTLGVMFNDGGGVRGNQNIMPLAQVAGQLIFSANGATVNNEELRNIARQLANVRTQITADKESKYSAESNMPEETWFRKASDTALVNSIVENSKAIGEKLYREAKSPLDAILIEQKRQNLEQLIIPLQIAVNSDKSGYTRNIKEIKTNDIPTLKQAAQISSVYKIMDNGEVYFWPMQTRISEKGAPVGIKFNSIEEFNKYKASL